MRVLRFARTEKEVVQICYMYLAVRGSSRLRSVAVEAKLAGAIS